MLPEARVAKSDICLPYYRQDSTPSVQVRYLWPKMLGLDDYGSSDDEEEVQRDPIVEVRAWKHLKRRRKVQDHY